jgi:hypothetical protein
MTKVALTSLAFVAVLSMMAVMAVAAQAAGELRVDKTVIADEAELEGNGEQSEFLVPGLGLEILCSGIIPKKVKLKIGNLNGMAHGTAHILYHGCHVVGNKFCKIYSTHTDSLLGGGAGLILLTGLVLLQTLSSPTRYLIVLSASSLATVYYTEGKGCTLPPETEIGGSTAFKIDAPTLEGSHEILDITSMEEGELGVALLYGEEALELDKGSSLMLLAGKYFGKAFSFN